MNDILKSNKIATRIPGFDDLLYGGLDLSHDNNLILVKGNENVDRTLFGIQMVYGIAQSLTKINYNSAKLVENHLDVKIKTNYQNKKYLDDLLLDTLIAHCIQKMTEKYISVGMRFQTNPFFNFFFNNNYCSICKKEKINITQQPTGIPLNIDNLICEEAIFYSNRTNSLHYRSVPFLVDDNTILYQRRYDSLDNYFKESERKDKNIFKQQIETLNNLIETPIINAEISEIESILSCWEDDEYNEYNKSGIYLYDLIDLENRKGLSWERILIALKNRSKVSVVVVPEELVIPDDLADMIIKIGKDNTNDYEIFNISITRSILQQTMLGKHQYKYRDYGIEVYPNIYSYFSRRKYLQRAIVYTHSDVVTNTYQQYLDGIRTNTYHGYGFDNFKCDKERIRTEYVKELVNPEESFFCSVDILERIFMSQSFDKHSVFQNNRSIITSYSGGVTAVIGNANTYKRYITFGGIFSSSLNEEHSLLLLLNKDDSIIRRRLSCPARIKNGKCDSRICKKCYSYIHFMNILMGNVTPAEFLYYLKKQIEIPYKDGKKLKRIIVDDMQIVDYCFPRLKNAELFIPSLVSLCREYNIDLYLLCDKTADSVSKIRAVADNVVCTSRDTDGTLLLYVEHYAGYDKIPSRIYCSKVKRPERLFECYETVDTENKPIRQYGIDESQVSDRQVPSMDDFWIGKMK